MITSRFFKEAEFQRCTPACSLQDMHQETMRKLDRAREIAGIPFVLTSASRTREHEIRQGRNGTSSHVPQIGGTRGVDIRAATSRNRFLVIKGLMAAEFDRIGVHPNFIHADDSPTHDKQVIWFY